LNGASRGGSNFHNTMPEAPYPPSDPAGVPPPLSYSTGPDASASSTGLTPNVAAGLACLLTFLSGIVFLVLEKRSQFVRFWAMQATIFGGVWFLGSVVLSIVGAVFAHIPVLGVIMGLLLTLVYVALNIVCLIVWIVMLVKSFSGLEWEIPILGRIARQQLANMNR
jgi:uncharacterized membrane protein